MTFGTELSLEQFKACKPEEPSFDIVKVSQKLPANVQKEKFINVEPLFSLDMGKNDVIFNTFDHAGVKLKRKSKSENPFMPKNSSKLPSQLRP